MLNGCSPKPAASTKRVWHGVVLFLLFATVSCTELPTRDNSSDELFQLQEATIASVHQAIRQSKINCVTLVQRYIERINRYDKSSGLNSIVLINPNAVARAQRLDKQWVDTGDMKALHCVPVILKDNFHTADMPTSAGSIVMKEFIAPHDAFMVRKLREADAIIVAKSNMGEWAFSPHHTISSSYGETRNAYDLRRVPAGSSGGSASAVAANFGLIGMGTDTGNSIRGPASHLALVGLRSTMGLTSRGGIVPLLSNRDIAGPMTRTVEDAARVFNVIAGFDADDNLTEHADQYKVDDYTRYLDKQGLNGARIGVLRDISNTQSFDPQIETLFENAITDMKTSGAVIIDPFEIPDLEILTQSTGFCSRFRHDINQYFASLGERAPVKNLEDIVERKHHLPISENAMKWAMSVNVSPQQQDIPCVDVAGDPRRKALHDAVVLAMEANAVDALIYPTWNHSPRLAGDVDSPHGNNSPIIAPHSGQPAITVPMGFTREGLPAGLQFLGLAYSEALLFKLTYAYEQATQHRKPPRQFP